MSTFAQDLRFALRQLSRQWGFALGVVLVLALGSGAGLAMFTVLRGTLLQRLPYRNAGNLIILRSHADDGRQTNNNLADVDVWQSRTRTLSDLAFFQNGEGFLEAVGTSNKVDLTPVSHNMWTVLGVEPTLGRGFTRADEESSAPVLVLSDILWRSVFHQDRQVLGRVVDVDGKARTIIGVMPPGFSFPLNGRFPQAWVPSSLPPSARARDFSSSGVQVIARRKDAVSLASVSEDLTQVQRVLRPMYTGGLAPALAPRSVEVLTLRDSLDQNARPALEAICAAVAVLWLIACASAAGLLLARSAARTHEFALRKALGASRWRLVRQLFTESLLLAALAVFVGTLLSSGLLAAAGRVLDRQLHHTLTMTLSVPALLAMAGSIVATAVGFGVVPAILLSRGSLEGGLREGSLQVGRSRFQSPLQKVLIVGELALTLTLLVACGLLLRTVFALRQIPLGFRTDHVLVAELQLPSFRYAHTDLLREIYRPLLERARQLPGVQTASLSTMMPLGGDFDMQYGMFITRQNGGKPEESYMKVRMATPEFQQVLRFRMYKGRYFQPADTANSQPVAVVNKAFSDRYDPDGKHWAAGDFSFGELKIVGIIDNFQQTDLLSNTIPELELSAAQLDRSSRVPFTGIYQTLMQAHVELALRTQLAPQVLRVQVEKLLRSADPALASSTIRSMDQIVDDSIGSQLLASRLLIAFSGIALLVALTGLFSLLSFSVASRTREFGVRLALGAQRKHVLFLVVRGAALLLVSGSLLGLLGTVATVHLLKSFLYGVRPIDPVTLTMSVVLLLFCGALAAFLPASRAATTDPMRTLRTE